MTSIRTLLVEDVIAVGVGRGVVEGWDRLPPRFCTLWAACEMFDKSAVCVELLAAGEADGAVSRDDDGEVVHEHNGPEDDWEGVVAELGY